jgi:hypothetical protein
MTSVQNFVADLARAGKGYLEIKETVEAAYGDKALRKRQFMPSSAKLKREKQRSGISTAKKPCPALIASFASPLKKTTGFASRL